MRYSAAPSFRTRCENRPLRVGVKDDGSCGDLDKILLSPTAPPNLRRHASLPAGDVDSVQGVAMKLSRFAGWNSNVIDSNLIYDSEKPSDVVARRDTQEGTGGWWRRRFRRSARDFDFDDDVLERGRSEIRNRAPRRLTPRNVKASVRVTLVVPSACDNRAWFVVSGITTRAGRSCIGSEPPGGIRSRTTRMRASSYSTVAACEATATRSWPAAADAGGGAEEQHYERQGRLKAIHGCRADQAATIARSVLGWSSPFLMRLS